MSDLRNLRNKHFLLADVRLDALQLEDLLELVDEAKYSGRKSLILNQNMHSLYLHETDTMLKRFYAEASWVYVDGLPLIWLAKLAGLPFANLNRITLLDSFDAVLARAERRGWRVFYLGSSDDVQRLAIPALRRKYPDLKLDGTSGYFNHHSEENDEVIRQINSFRSDLLFVGMGVPVQERWIDDNYSKIETSAILNSGATLDYVTGDAYRPPAWVGSVGLYGVGRLLSDPKRLWRRYLIEPFLLLRILGLRLAIQRFRQLNQGPVTLDHIGLK